jgi:hypothetical protein
MSMANRSSLVAGAALAAFLAAALAPSDAHARHGWRVRGRVGAVIGAVLADVVIGAAVEAASPPPVWVAPYPQPVPVPVPYAPPPVVYAPPPPPCCYVAPAPAPPMVVMQAAPPVREDYPRVGLAFGGLVDSPRSGQMPVGGVVGALQVRTSSHSLMLLELQSLGARRISDDLERSELVGLLGGRVFPWDAFLTPYLELAGGFGRASVEANGYAVHASQLVGRIGVGLELRLGRHLVLDGAVAQVHRLRMDGDGSSRLDLASAEPFAAIGEHERATEIRGGLAFRF